MEDRIIFITNKCPPYRLPVFNELSKKLNIKFVFTHENKIINELRANYVLLKGIGFKKFKIHPEIIKIIKKEKPTKVVLLPPDPLHLIDNLILYKFCKKNNISYSLLVGRWEYKNIPLKQKLTEPIYKKILKRADKLIAYGTKSEEWLLKRGVKKSKIIKAYNINPEVYKNFSIKKKKLSEFKNKKVILYVGRLIKRKGIDYLIKAFSKVKDKNTLLVLVGGGDFYQLGAKSEEAKLKKLVQDLGIEKKVIFTGEVSPKRTQKYYQSADLFVLPSITLDVGEAWGHVVEEAMSFGLPVIATDAVGSAYDLIENGKNGFVVKEKNISELKKAIKKIISNKKLREKMGKESLKIIKQDKFSFESILEKWVKALS